MQYIKEVCWAFKVPHLTTSISHERHKDLWGVYSFELF